MNNNYAISKYIGEKINDYEEIIEVYIKNKKNYKRKDIVIKYEYKIKYRIYNIYQYIVIFDINTSVYVLQIFFS